MPSVSTCPICSKTGDPLRKFSPEKLIRLYSDYSKMPLPAFIINKYIKEPVQENLCKDCGVRWYLPGSLGESDFYEFLSQFPGYYNPGSWDKVTSVDILKSLSCRTAVDVGCGDGWLLKKAGAAGVQMVGVEINEAVVNSAKSLGLDVYLPNDSALTGLSFEAMVSLQTLEHIENPVEWLLDQIHRFQPKYIILAVPAHDTILGFTSDPLVWPPHHRTLWSGQALERLASKVGYAVRDIRYQPNSWYQFNNTVSLEPNRTLWNKFPFPKGRLGHCLFRALKLFNVNWVNRAHSVIAVLESKSTTRKT